MADLNVDKAVNNAQVEKWWKNTTRDLLKLRGYNEMLIKFCKIAEEVNEEYYSKNTFPKNWELGNLKITKIADKYGLKPKGKKLRVCPFHKDKLPSLSLNDDLGLFNCFGCGEKGNIIKFLAMLKKVKQNAHK